MKNKLLFFSFLIIVIPNVVKASLFVQSFDKTVFYEVLKTGSVKQINHLLSILKSSSINEKEAYEGTLLMKKAGLVKEPKEKLKFFRAGRIKLETVLLSDSSNVEYHFLRLIIQEHAPEIVKYKDRLQEDSIYIKKYFKNLSTLVQQRVIDYSKTSKLLRIQDY